jgi:Flp pilus assembly protein protease CpaA
MKQLLTFFFTTLLAAQTWATNFDFSAKTPSGQTLFYAITGSTEPYTVVVVYPNYSKDDNDFYSGYPKPAGTLEIPSSVTNGEITYSVTSIDGYAFTGCSGLKSVAIPESVESIDGYAFFGCSGLTSVTIPNSVTSIGSCAFSGCSGLKSVAIPESVESIDDYAFSGCSGLTSVTIPNSVTSIGSSAFEECSNLTTVTISEGVTNIGEAAFFRCFSLTSVTIPNSVTSIGDMAFDYCTSLASVAIGNSVTSIGSSAFEDCISLASIVIAEENTKYDSRNNCNAIIETETNTLVLGCKNTIIPNTITSIGWFAFYHCKDLTSVSIPNSVTYIGGNAFVDCSNLTSVTIPNTVTYIGNGAFAFCANATIYCEEEGEPDEWDMHWNESGGKVVWGSEMPTAVDSEASTNVKIYATSNIVIVENPKNEIFVYNAMGRLVGRDVACRVRAAITVKGAGVYIVKTGGVVKRVMVN